MIKLLVCRLHIGPVKCSGFNFSICDTNNLNHFYEQTINAFPVAITFLPRYDKLAQFIKKKFKKNTQS